MPHDHAKPFLAEAPADAPDLFLDILRDSEYGLSLFREEELEAVRERVFFKESRGNSKPYIKCLVRTKDVQLKPEELVRQLYLARLIDHYGYTHRRLAVEHPVHFGREVKRADIVIFDADRPTVPYVMVELKKPKLTEGKNQLRSYCNATGAPIGVWTNGGQISHYHRKDPNYFEDISDIPTASQTLADILNERFTFKDLIVRDKIPNEGKSLKQLILEMEDEVLANAGVDVFEEVFKLVFTKLYDEFQSKTDKGAIEHDLRRILNESQRADYQTVKETLLTYDDKGFRAMEFRNTGQSDGQLKEKIQKLFDDAKEVWHGIFPEGSKIDLSPSHLAVCVSSLQDVKLFNSNLQVVDEAFEYLVNKSAKGDKGQYFTPRHVIDMCVKMLNPKREEYMIDTASGSCGFPVHTIFYKTGRLFANADLTAEDRDAILRVFGIDFDEKAVRVARTLNLIAGDGETNVLHLNTLDYERWDEVVKEPSWFGTYGKGFERLKKLRARKDSYKEFLFDVLMANPPFAGDIKESRITHRYDLAQKENGKWEASVSRDILFIERNLDFLKPGGRMAIVLPQGRFNNISDKRLREFIAEHGRILAIVSLHSNTFKPHTNTKTSVLFIQKWNDDPTAGPLCPRVGDYPIFFAVSEQGGKDNSGEYVYVENPDGSAKLDKYGHLIVRHDLHNHDGELPDGIAENFVEFAKRNNLFFWKSENNASYN